MQGFLTLSLSSLGGLRFYLQPSTGRLKQDAEAGGHAMSAEKVKAERRGVIAISSGYAAEPGLNILALMFFISRPGLYIFQDTFRPAGCLWT